MDKDCKTGTPAEFLKKKMSTEEDAMENGFQLEEGLNKRKLFSFRNISIGAGLLAILITGVVTFVLLNQNKKTNVPKVKFPITEKISLNPAILNNPLKNETVPSNVNLTAVDNTTGEKNQSHTRSVPASHARPTIHNSANTFAEVLQAQKARLRAVENNSAQKREPDSTVKNAPIHRIFDRRTRISPESDSDSEISYEPGSDGDYESLFISDDEISSTLNETQNKPTTKKFKILTNGEVKRPRNHPSMHQINNNTLKLRPVSKSGKIGRLDVIPEETLMETPKSTPIAKPRKEFDITTGLAQEFDRIQKYLPKPESEEKESDSDDWN